MAYADYDRDSFHARKAERRRHYEQNVMGWKLRTCTACGGSGRYDNGGSPRCACCGGTGKERYKEASHGLR